MTIIGYQTVFGSLGFALAFDGTHLIVVNHNLYEFTTRPAQIVSRKQNPERLALTLLISGMAGKI